LPVQVLWINMVSVAVLGLVLAMEAKEPDIMLRQPRNPETPILTQTLIWRIVIVGLIILAGAFGLFSWWMQRGASLAEARTIAVNVVIFIMVFYLLNCRSLTQSMFTIGVFSNRWVIAGVFAMVLLQLLFTYAPFMNEIMTSAPIGPQAWAQILAVSLIGYVVIEIEKLLRRITAKRTEQRQIKPG
jgi:Ca2+-transporting ATPase